MNPRAIGSEEEQKTVPGTVFPTNLMSSAQTWLERDEERWNPVFLANHATTEKSEQDEVSIKHHPALESVWR